MPTNNHKPVTRAELRSELRQYATKKDLKAAIAKCATKEDLKATRRDLEAAIAKCVQKADFEVVVQRIVLKLGEVLDVVQALKEQSATKAEMGIYVSAVDKVSKDHELLWNKALVQDERLRVVEDQGKRHSDRISSLEAKATQ